MDTKYELVVELMRECGDGLVSLAGKIEDIGVKKLWLTEKDVEIEKKITRLVSGFGKDHKVFAEEISNEYEEAKNVWVIDPISHTFNFLHGLPHYCVVVAHQEDGVTKFAAVYDPAVRELFVAVKNDGVTLNGIRVEVNQVNKDVCLLFDPQMPCGRFGDADRAKIYGQMMSVGRMKALGSAALFYAYVACGRVQGSIDLNKDMFTVLPGLLMVMEAGGKCTDFYGNEVGMETVGVVVSNGLIHDKLLTITQNY